MRNHLVRLFALYTSLFHEPGAKGFAAAGFVSRLTMSMVTVGLILAVTVHGGGYATAGVAVAALTLASGVALPVFGRLFDRYGQRRVLIPMVLAFGALMLLLIGAIAAGASSWLVVLLAAAAGMPMPVALTLAAQRSTEPEPSGRAAQARWTAGPLRVPALRALYLARFCIGGVFGALPIATVAYATAHHDRASSGLLLAGVTMAPVTVSAMEVMQLVVPASMLTETISWDTTALAFGMTARSAVVGATSGQPEAVP
jgi:MFS family permease